MPSYRLGAYRFSPTHSKHYEGMCEAPGKHRAGPFTLHPQECAGLSSKSTTALTSVFLVSCHHWRNARKYQSRTYRHFGWDNGTLLANMLAVTAASGLPAEIVFGFVDAEVNGLLDLDARGEVSLCLVAIVRTSERSLAAPREAPVLRLETIPLSEHEVEYPAMLEMHDASSLESEAGRSSVAREATDLPIVRYRWRGSSPPATAGRGAIQGHESYPVRRSEGVARALNEQVADLQFREMSDP